MSVQRTPKVGLDSTFGLIAKRLRDESEERTREPLPKRWIELIQYLNEQERTREGGQHAESEPLERRDR